MIRREHVIRFDTHYNNTAGCRLFVCQDAGKQKLQTFKTAPDR